jgi:methylmalonyl-CoA mutase cobalamin-binding subunit
VSKNFSEWYQKTDKTEGTNRLTLMAFKVAAIQERMTAVLLSISKEAFADNFQKLYERCQQCVIKDGNYFEGQ